MSTTTQAQTPRILLGITGCIAAYKAAEVLRGLQKAGAEVRVVMTEAATRFVGPLTFKALTSYEPLVTLEDWQPSPIGHIALAEWADIQVICPCTANVMGKIAQGIADDALTSTVLAAQSPVMLAPAMNVHMWQNPATQANLKTVQERGIQVITPVSGRLACGDVGEGKLPEVDLLVDAIMGAVAAKTTPQVLAGTHCLITAGPTHEAIDPVRYIANASSGKMGYALAQAARNAGAKVTLVTGPVDLAKPYGVDCIPVTSAAELYASVMDAVPASDLVICAAAVADYTPLHPADHKLKKSHEHLDTLELKETTDVLKSVCELSGSRTVIGFAAETNDVAAHAKAKLERKGADMIVANDVSKSESTFGSDTNAVTLITAQGSRELPAASKDDIASEIIAAAAQLMQQNQR